jgi:hypothetical protein
VLAMAFALFSCNDDDGKAPAPSKTDLLTSKSWKLVTWSITLGTYNVDMLDFTDACTKDNLLIFSKDGKIIEDAGLQKCFSGNPQIYRVGIWVFDGNETKLKMTYANSYYNPTTTYNIDVLNTTTLRISFNTDSSSDVRTYTAQ